MPISPTLENQFKPEIRTRGREEYEKDLGFIQSANDTQIQGTVKSMPPSRVKFSCNSISERVFQASCTCSSAGRGNLCKHIYTVLLLVEEKHPDFLDAKNNIYIETTEVKKNPRKEKQKEYQKQQYEKQKQYQKEKKAEKEKKESVISETFAPEVEEALNFFEVNGFDLQYDKDDEQLKKAKKQLARVFHPDKGGSHNEAVKLNENYEILSKHFAKIARR